MSVALRIHVVDGVPERLVDVFTAPTFYRLLEPGRPDYEEDEWEAACRAIEGTDSVWVADVGWPKAGPFGAATATPPDIARIVMDAIPPYPPTPVTDGLIRLLERALGRTHGSAEYETADPDGILAWLRDRRGRRVITVTW